MIVLENKRFSLTLSEEGRAIRLISRTTGERLLAREDTPFCSVTQARPYNNEIKLAHPNKEMTFSCRALRLEDGKLIASFELIRYEAVIGVHITDDYIAFKLEDFLVPYEAFEYLKMTPPPVTSFRIMQLAIKERAKFGEWLNVAWDEATAVNVLATSPYARIEGEKRDGYRLMYADARLGIKLRGCEAALIVADNAEHLDCIDTLERDYNLPLGVQSRRDPRINASVYWSYNVRPDTVDEHIALAKQAGLRLMLLYYPSLYKTSGYSYCGDYDYLDCYPNGAADVKAMLDKIKAAGITPGIHFLQTHIGLKSRYVTPVCDHRLNLTRRFTLARPLTETDTTIYVEEDPTDTTTHPDTRVLRFGGELIQYEAYTTERPYCFTGCVRGHLDTHIRAHEAGLSGGILDISEFAGISCYIDQTTDLQDEVAVKLAEAYNAGFEFVYYDGSEGTNAPFDHYVPLAQYRVYTQLNTAPIFCEGAAKAHFSWHMLSGGNAFDVFPMNIFKEKIIEFPFEEAPRMAMDKTRLNFGWWRFAADTQADIYEFGTAKAAAYDCPVTIQMNPAIMKAHPRLHDILEVMARWEDVRARNLLTEADRAALRQADKEHTLLRKGDRYALVEIEPIDAPADITAFAFTYEGQNWAVLWHRTGEADLKLAGLTYAAEPGEAETAVTDTLTVGNKIYLRGATSEALKKAIREA